MNNKQNTFKTTLFTTNIRIYTYIYIKTNKTAKHSIHDHQCFVDTTVINLTNLIEDRRFNSDGLLSKVLLDHKIIPALLSENEIRRLVKRVAVLPFLFLFIISV